MDQELAAEFDGFEKEYESVRSRAGLIDLSFRGRLKVSGKDRVSFLHRLLSVDIKNLKSGECITGCFLTGTAKIQCLLDVYAGEDALWIDTHESKAAHVAELFEKFHFNEDVNFEDVTGEYAEIAVEGPDSDSWRGHFSGDIVMAKSISGEKGFRVWCLPSKALPGIPWVGFKALETLRLEAGEPYFGIDITDATLQPETGRDDWASTTKGCYAGQEIIQRVRNFGHPSRLLVKLETDTAGDLRGAKILSDGSEAGVITSSAFSPRSGKTVALGYVAYDKRNNPKFEINGAKAVISER